MYTNAFGKETTPKAQGANKNKEIHHPGSTRGKQHTRNSVTPKAPGANNKQGIPSPRKQQGQTTTHTPWRDGCLSTTSLSHTHASTWGKQKTKTSVTPQAQGANQTTRKSITLEALGATNTQGIPSPRKHGQATTNTHTHTHTPKVLSTMITAKPYN